MTKEHRAVHCSVDQCELQNDNGNYIRSVEVTCSKCGHITQSFGTSERSIKRCLVLMRDECPLGEENYYVADEGIEAIDPNPAVDPETDPDPEALFYDQDDIPY